MLYKMAPVPRSDGMFEMMNNSFTVHKNKKAVAHHNCLSYI